MGLAERVDKTDQKIDPIPAPPASPALSCTARSGPRRPTSACFGRRALSAAAQALAPIHKQTEKWPRLPSM